MTTPLSDVTGMARAYASPAVGTTATNATGTSTSGTSTSAATSSMLDPQAFLQLLVAQLKYQDPTNPTDTSTFMNQTAMLSQVQTMGTMSSTLSTLAQSQQVQSATSMIGKQVTYLDATGMRASGVVSSANIVGGTATLKVGDTSVPLSGVVEVALPSAK